MQVEQDHVVACGSRASKPFVSVASFVDIDVLSPKDTADQASDGPLVIDNENSPRARQIQWRVCADGHLSPHRIEWQTR